MPVRLNLGPPTKPAVLAAQTATGMATPTSTMPSRANLHNGLTATATASEMKPRATKQMPVLQPVEPQHETGSAVLTAITTARPMATRRGPQQTAPMPSLPMVHNGPIATVTATATIRQERTATPVQRPSATRPPTDSVVPIPTATATLTPTDRGALTTGLMHIPTTRSDGATTTATATTTASTMIVQRSTAPPCTTAKAAPTRTATVIQTPTAAGPPRMELTPS